MPRETGTETWACNPFFLFINGGGDRCSLGGPDYIELEVPNLRIPGSRFRPVQFERRQTSEEKTRFFQQNVFVFGVSLYGLRRFPATGFASTHFLWQKSSNCVFAIKMVFPKSIKFRNSGSESNFWVAPLHKERFPMSLKARASREGLVQEWAVVKVICGESQCATFPMW